MLHPISTYDAITQQKSAGMWNSSLALSPGRMGTLDFYYKIYELVLKYEPQKTRGYRSRICYNEQIIKSLWGGYLKTGTMLDIYTLKDAVREMEKIIWI